MATELYFRFDYDNKMNCKCPLIIEREVGNLKIFSTIYCVKATAKIDFILDTHTTVYNCQAFYKFQSFRQVCIMMIIRCRNMQTNQYYMKAIMHQLFARTLPHSNGNKITVFPGCVHMTQLADCDGTTTQAHNHGEVEQKWERLILPIRWW